MTAHTRLSPHRRRLLEDRQWHADAELEATTSFPHEWLKEVEREHELERRGDSPQMIRLWWARAAPSERREGAAGPGESARNVVSA